MVLIHWQLLGLRNICTYFFCTYTASVTERKDIVGLELEA